VITHRHDTCIFVAMVLTEPVKSISAANDTSFTSIEAIKCGRYRKCSVYISELVCQAV
jgi:ADP-ribosylglycohydrolase